MRARLLSCVMALSACDALLLGTLLAALGAGGCVEEEEGSETPDTGTTTPDSGGVSQDAGSGTDSGARDTGAADAGMDAGPTVICGGKVCMTHEVSPLLPRFAAGCAKSVQDAEVCGLIGTAANAYPEGGFPLFLESHAPGVDSLSCGAFLERMIEGPLQPNNAAGQSDSGYPNMQVDTKRMIPINAQMNVEVALIYPGCCTPLGFCSANQSKGTSVSAFGQYPSNGGFGCLDPKVFLQAAPKALQQVKCDPQTGVIFQTDPSGGSNGGASDAGADGGNS